MPQVARMFCLWVAVVLVDGLIAATVSPSNTAGYLTLVGCLVIILWAALSEPEANYL